MSSPSPADPVLPGHLAVFDHRLLFDDSAARGDLQFASGHGVEDTGLLREKSTRRIEGKGTRGAVSGSEPRVSFGDCAIGALSTWLRRQPSTRDGYRIVGRPLRDQRAESENDDQHCCERAHQNRPGYGNPLTRWLFAM